MSLKVVLKRKGRADKSFTLPTENPGESVLDDLEAAGNKVPFGCRAGSCGVCRVVVEKGLEHFEAMGPVEEDTVARIPKSDGGGSLLRLSCRAQLKKGANGELVLLKPEDPEE